MLTIYFQLCFFNNTVYSALCVIYLSHWSRGKIISVEEFWRLFDFLDAIILFFLIFFLFKRRWRCCEIEKLFLIWNWRDIIFAWIKCTWGCWLFTGSIVWAIDLTEQIAEIIIRIQENDKIMIFLCVSYLNKWLFWGWYE